PGTVAELMRKPYPELAETVDRVAGVIKREEEAFLGTIDGGLERIEKLFKAIETSGAGLVGGADAAELYTTYGFPPELLETLAAERNCAFDWNGFREAMDAHGQRSGAGSRVEVFTSGPLDALKKAMHGSEFVGYDTLETGGKVIGIIAQDRLCDSLREVGHSAPVTVVLDHTCFYGESGGQVGDTGTIDWRGGSFEVIDTQREGGFMLHIGHLREGTLAGIRSVSDRSWEVAVVLPAGAATVSMAVAARAATTLDGQPTAYTELPSTPINAGSQIAGGWGWDNPFGNGASVDVKSVAVDQGGNVFVVGSYAAEFDLDPGPGTAPLPRHSTAARDGFLAKYGPNGGLLWGLPLSGAGGGAANGVAVDAAGTVSVTGFSRGTATFYTAGGSPVTRSGLGGSDVFLAKYSATGGLLFAGLLGGSLDDEGVAIALDAVGSTVVTGHYTGDATFGSRTLTSDSVSRDMFLFRITPEGNEWASSFGGSTSDEEVTGVAVDAAGNLVVAG
ncbi:hypothetical protein EBR04_09620, partial [bacterium]|nr:hypothetical protein [bacterium]